MADGAADVLTKPVELKSEHTRELEVREEKLALHKSELEVREAKLESARRELESARRELEVREAKLESYVAELKRGPAEHEAERPSLADPPVGSDAFLIQAKTRAVEAATGAVEAATDAVKAATRAVAAATGAVEAKSALVSRLEEELEKQRAALSVPPPPPGGPPTPQVDLSQALAASVLQIMQQHQDGSELARALLAFKLPALPVAQLLDVHPLLRDSAKGFLTEGSLCNVTAASHLHIAITMCLFEGVWRHGENQQTADAILPLTHAAVELAKDAVAASAQSKPIVLFDAAPSSASSSHKRVRNGDTKQGGSGTPAAADASAAAPHAAAVDGDSASARAPLASRARPDMSVLCGGFVAVRWEHKRDRHLLQLAEDEAAGIGDHTGKYAAWSAHDYADMGFLIVGASAADMYSLGYRLPDGSTHWVSRQRSLMSIDALHSLLSALCAATMCFLLRQAREGWVRFAGKPYLQVVDNPKSYLPKDAAVPDPPVLCKDYRVATGQREETRSSTWAYDLQAFYELAAPVDGLERGIRRPKLDSFIVYPVGLPIRPTRPLDYQQAIKDLTLTLARLHDLGLCHNDVRWDNVVLAVTSRARRWLLIDCEYGAVIGKKKPLLPSNTAWADTRADGMGEATELRDMRSIGKMIKEFAAHLSPAVADLAAGLCSDSDKWQDERTNAFAQLFSIASQ